MSSSKPRDDPPPIGLGGTQLERLRNLVTRYTRTGVRSTRDVLAYLDRRGASPEKVAQVLGECRRRGLLDDRACARLWADTWARKGYAWAAIRAKLTEKGLDEDAVEYAGSRLGVASALGDEARARDLLRRRITPSTSPTRAQAARLLAARGFDADLSERLLNESFGRPPS